MGRFQFSTVEFALIRITVLNYTVYCSGGRFLGPLVDYFLLSKKQVKCFSFNPNLIVSPQKMNENIFHIFCSVYLK